MVECGPLPRTGCIYEQQTGANKLTVVAIYAPAHISLVASVNPSFRVSTYKPMGMAGPSCCEKQS